MDFFGMGACRLGQDGALATLEIDKENFCFGGFMEKGRSKVEGRDYMSLYPANNFEGELPLILMQT
jgi:hypothetical protein